MIMRLVSKVLQTPDVPKTRHYIGSPIEAGDGIDQREMSSADILLIEEREDGIFLFRFTARGEGAGDTCHLSVDDAKHQAQYTPVQDRFPKTTKAGFTQKTAKIRFWTDQSSTFIDSNYYPWRRQQMLLSLT